MRGRKRTKEINQQIEEGKKGKTGKGWKDGNIQRKKGRRREGEKKGKYGDTSQRCKGERRKMENNMQNKEMKGNGLKEGVKGERYMEREDRGKTGKE